MAYTDTNSYDEKRLTQCVDNIEKLPSFPSITLKALILSLEEDVALNKLALIIQEDPGLVISVLDRVNSVEKSLTNKISDVVQAVYLLGLSDLQCILLNNLSLSLFRKERKVQLKYQKEILSHSLACGIFSHLISKITYPELKQESFSAGILHDIGKLAMLSCEGENYIEAADLGKKMGDSVKAEQEALKYNHTQVGARLSKKWNLPESLIDIICYHHMNVRILSSQMEMNPLFFIVKLANILSHEFFFDGSIMEEEKKEKELLASKLKLSPFDIKEITSIFFREYREKATLFDLEGDVEKIYLETLEKANKRVSNLALKLNIQKKRLKRSYQLQKIVNEIGISLYKCSSVKEVFQQVASVFIKLSEFKAGLIYILDRENWILEGYIWHKGKTIRSIRCFLDKEGRPIWDQQTSKFPSVLKELFSSYKERIRMGSESVLGLAVYSNPPFYTIPIYSHNIQIQGELCFAPYNVGYNLSEEEKFSLYQVVKLVVYALENIKLIERLEKKNEELSFALWKNQQLQKKILHTERLAVAGQLAAGAAHEINNPLAVINARAQLLHLKEKDETKKKHLTQIMDQIDRISSILTRLMDFARPVPPALISVDIHELLDKVLDFVAPGLRKHSIIVEKNYDENLPNIKADPGQLEQVLLNLIINAEHAMKEKGGRLVIKTYYDDSNKHINIKIIDEGCGIPEKHLRNIFDPFFTTKSPGEGTGLGLSISNSIIENHYGRLEIYSKEGKGTTVKISLPIDIHELREVDSLENFSKQKKELGISPRVLIVDDEKHIREILSETLEAEDMETMCSSNGAEALELIDREKFDLILLDVKMPILDGISFIRSIEKKGLKIPIILITGMATHEEISEALSRGAYKCIKKPFHIKCLLKDIKDVLKGEGFFEGPGM